MIAFGPVPSRRLGRSLGINNIPPKICSYSCVYCQVGKTAKMQVERSHFYDPQEIYRAVKGKVEKAQEKGESIDSVEYIIGYEGNAFSSTGDIKNDLLSITAVHPMRKDAVSEFLMRAGVDWSIVQQLIAQDKLLETEFKGRKFYIRNLKQ